LDIASTFCYSRNNFDSSVTGVRVARTLAFAGPVGVVLLTVALLLPGAPVRTDQPVAEIARMLATQRTAFALSIFIAGLGLLFFCVFAASLYRLMAATNHPLPGVAAAAATMTGVVLIVVGMSALTGLTLNPPSTSSEGLAVVRAAADTGNLIIGLAKFAFTAAILCAIGDTSDILSRRMRVTGAVAAVTLLSSALPPLLAARGIGQFGGPVDLIGSGLALLWILALSVVVTARLQR
jgi:hypothetical protein